MGDSKQEFLEAFRNRDKEKVLTLLKITKTVPSEIKYDDNVTLLHHAADIGWTDVCRRLVELYQVDAHAKSNLGSTALHYACGACDDHADTVKYLVNQAHCDPLAKSNNGYTPFMISSGQSRIFLQDIIDKSKKEGFSSVVEYIKTNFGNAVIDYTFYFERAAAQGTVTTRLSSVGLFGAAGTGKTSTVRLLTDQEPEDEHDSSPVMKPEEFYKTTEDNITVTGAGANDVANEDSDWDSESDEPVKSSGLPETQKHVRAAKQDILIAEGDRIIKEWMPATQEVLIHRLGNYVATLALTEAKQGTADSIDAACSLIDGFSIVERKEEIETNLGDIEMGESIPIESHVDSVAQTNPIACVSDIIKNILEFAESRKDLQKLGITHFVSMCDTGGQAAFLDIAPALLSFNSVNLVLFKLNESLDDPAKFFYCIKGQIVGCEKRQITTRSLIYSMVSCKSKIMAPRVKGKLTEGSQYRKPACL